MSHALKGHPRWMGHNEEFWQNVVHWRREWQTTSVFLPWEPHEQYEQYGRVRVEFALPLNICGNLWTLWERSRPGIASLFQSERGSHGLFWFWLPQSSALIQKVYGCPQMSSRTWGQTQEGVSELRGSSLNGAWGGCWLWGSLAPWRGAAVQVEM